ncbi:hypothetical protein GCM10011348_39530 [Marinobacterium nitratireducens]|uniref:Uncharacterized protein n=1 Tax=Marinobacterium nitratireducens TaxID=518897 RepID=A0A917ZNB2_9GAMM|nr:hypothetical protein [Marinobacterium nitratireducens]GGO87108.1 hypothetical protein GCM10011348_39530 [Marinobacterium nitratireducens]
MASNDDHDRQHRNWMDVTGTALHPVHSASGYKGAPRRPLIRPRPAPSQQETGAAQKG